MIRWIAAAAVAGVVVAAMRLFGWRPAGLPVALPRSAELIAALNHTA